MPQAGQRIASPFIGDAKHHPSTLGLRGCPPLIWPSSEAQAGVSASREVALPGAHLQGHLILLLMLVGCWVVIVSRGGGGGGPPLLSLGLLEPHKQLEGWFGHWVGHIVGDINLGVGCKDGGLGNLGLGEGSGRATARMRTKVASTADVGTTVTLFGLQLPKWVQI